LALYLLLMWKTGKTFSILYLFAFVYFLQYIFSTYLIYNEYQVLNKQMEVTGQVPPAVQVTQQLKANLQSGAGGMPAPVTAPAPGQAAAAMLPWNNGQPSPGGAPLIAGATPFANAGTVYYGGGGLQPGQTGALPQQQFAGFPAPQTVVPPAMTVGPLARQT
jgi:hypothetical protein